MMHDFIIFFAGTMWGAAMALWAAFHYALNRPARKVDFQVTPEAISTLNERLVFAWLENRGLMWQSKGLEQSQIFKGAKK